MKKYIFDLNAWLSAQLYYTAAITRCQGLNEIEIKQYVELFFLTSDDNDGILLWGCLGYGI